jgi:2-polyprenyl-3-methyl-5-hydroxy-6-metoxy-1,4-benzoquinol methylase
MMNYVEPDATKELWPEIDTAECVITGNVAKVKVLHKLLTLISRRSGLSILDIGCVGPQPLEFWEALLVQHGSRFELSGVDVAGIEVAREVAVKRGWTSRLTLREGSGYNLTELFTPQSFDIVVATQVLEHVAQIHRFMKQVATVLKPGGEAFFTADSAHWQSRFDPRDPVRMAKNVAKKGLASLGDERHYDLPWLDYEVAGTCSQVGLETVECRYYNLSPLKFIHNQIVPTARKNSFMRIWLELEEFLNADESIRNKMRKFFMALYLHARKPYLTS